MLPLVGGASEKALYIWLWAGPHKAEGRDARGSCGECELGDRILYLTLLFYSKKSLPPCKWKMGWGTGGEISWAILRAISCREKEGKNLQSDFIFVSLPTCRIFLPLVISFFLHFIKCPSLCHVLIMPGAETWWEGELSCKKAFQVCKVYK